MPLTAENAAQQIQVTYCLIYFNMYVIYVNMYEHV